jgi:predicted restriction endonuclease
MLEKSWANKLTRSLLGNKCIICGSYAAEMHHVRKIRELKQRKHLSWFTMQMAAVNRKQVPLCKAHHMALHKNKLTPAEKELFANGCKLIVKP